MKVFLSWSGDHAKRLAGLLMEWLPNVVQSIEPWTSEEIGKGTRWSDEIARELDESRFGILCVDRDHLTSPWIHFEAGAIAKSVKGATARNRVTPLLLGIDEADLRDPLGLFQATKLDKEDMFRLVRSLNDVQDTPLDLTRLAKAFEQWWPELESQVSDLKPIAATGAANDAGSETDRPPGEILEEVLHLLRDQRRAVTRLEQSATQSLPPYPTEAPATADIEGHWAEARTKFRQLGLVYDRLVWGLGKSVTVKLNYAPPLALLAELEVWATQTGWDLTVEAPERSHRLGVRRSPD